MGRESEPEGKEVGRGRGSSKNSDLRGVRVRDSGGSSKN